MAMADAHPIDPTSFDLIVIGTGFPQCIVAAAAASAGHSVLHLDPCDFYGSHWASLPLQDFLRWLACGGLLPPPSGVPATAGIGSNADTIPNGSGLTQDLFTGDAPDSGLTLEDGFRRSSTSRSEAEEWRLVPEQELAELGLEAVRILDRSYYSHFTVFQTGEDLLGPSRSYNIDLSGPKLAFCGGPLIDLLLRSGASNYLEFKGLEASYMWTPSGLSTVPSSRADVFRDRSLSPLEKRHLMRFFKLVIEYTTSASQADLSDEELDASFLELLHRQQLPPPIQAIILYAITLASDDQERLSEGPSTIIKARDGLDSLALYLSSVGRFPNASGAFLYPLYGQGELPQAFSRCAAVKGAIHVLRMNVNALLRNKENLEYKGVMTASGQLLFSQKLVTGPLQLCSERVSSMSTWESQPGIQSREHENYSAEGISADLGQELVYIARGICITNKSLQPGQSTILMVFPPKSVSEQVTTVIRALQLGSNASVCPEGKFLVQLSTVCSEWLAGIESLQAATRHLFISQNSGAGHDVSYGALNGNVILPVAGEKPCLLFSAFYIQQANCVQIPESWGSSCQIAVCSMPDGMLDYRASVISAEKIFEGLFPGEHFFPPSVQATNGTEDGVENARLMHPVENPEDIQESTQA